MTMLGHWSSRISYMYCRTLLLVQCNSTVAHSRIGAAPRRDHIPRTPFAPCPQYMGTWTDRLKKRWQSGDQTKDDKKNKDAECETTASNSNTSELEKTLGDKEEQIKASEEKIKDLQDKYLRALAEAENTRNRLTRQVAEAKKFGIQDFSKDVVEVADILDKAVGSVKDEDLKDNKPLADLYQGLKLTEAELNKVMSKNGLTPIKEDGVAFDPNIHEALFEVPGEKEGTVAVVSRVGYILHGRTIRPARVGVVKAAGS